LQSLFYRLDSLGEVVKLSGLHVLVGNISLPAGERRFGAHQEHPGIARVVGGQQGHPRTNRYLARVIAY
jgi:hypothetical protein